MEVEAIIKTLETAPFKCYLGGSRAMNARDPQAVPITSHTDYDYYATYTDEARSYLANHQFTLSVSTGNPYRDDEAIEVWKHNRVEVVLRQDALFYKKVFDSIKPSDFALALHKSGPNCPSRDMVRHTMNALFSVAKAFQGTAKTQPTFDVEIVDPIKAYERAMKGIS